LNKLPVRQVLKRRNLDYKDFDSEETISRSTDIGAA
jgi:hypothetical protein